LYDDVLLQTWALSRCESGDNGQYWIIDKSGRVNRPLADPDVRNCLRSVQEQEQAYLVRWEHGRNSGALIPWMERTRWAITYDGLYRDLLRRLAAMSYPGGVDVFLTLDPGAGTRTSGV
jgi:hypothetical protein